MKERPILFSAEMVRAILAGRKTMTRRVIKPQPIMMDSGCWYPSSVPGDAKNSRGLHYANEAHMRKGMPIDFSPYGQPGDRLWVRETWRCIEQESGLDGVLYRADGNFFPIENTREASERWGDAKREGNPWRPSIFMPRWASRITLKIVSIRVERVQEISEVDAIKEGIQMSFQEWRKTGKSRIPSFRELWDSINAKRGYGWDENPWVWVIEFRSKPKITVN